MKGILSFGGAVIFGRVLQIFAFIFMARWLSKEQMGAVGLLAALFAGMHSLTNLGFDRYLIHSDRDDHEHVGSSLDVIWSLQLVRGLLILLLSFVCGLVMANFTQFGKGLLLPSLGIGMGLLVYNLQNPSIVLFERGGNFNYLSKIRSFAFIASSLLIILSAPIMQNVWVYVYSQIVNCMVYAALSYYYAERKPSWRLEPQAMKEVLSYSKSILIISVVSFLAAQFESFYVGFMFGPLILGYYFTWARVVNLPREIFSQFLEQILFPKACAQRREGGGINTLHLGSFILSVVLIFPIYFFIWFHGELAMSLLAGQGWGGYLWLGRYFVAISALYLICTTISPFMMANYPKESGYIRAVEAALLVASMFALGHVLGLHGVVYSILGSMAIATVVRLYVLYRYLIVDGRLQHVIVCILFILINFIPLRLLENWLGNNVALASSRLVLLGSYALCSLAIVACCGVYVKKLKANGRLAF